MKKNKKSHKTASSILLALFLALICIGGVELAVCSHFSPELYSRITAPVRAGFQQLAEVGDALWTKLGISADRAAERLEETAVRLRDAWETFQTRPAEDSEDLEDVELQLVDDETVEPPPKSQASYSTTAIAMRYGREYLTGGAHEVVYYDQTDDRWADKLYGSDRIGSYGCGPTVMAMVAATLAQADTNPEQMAQLCVEKGYWASKHGSYHAIVPGIAEEYGLSCASLSLEEVSESTILQHLVSGHLVVALMGPGHFTNSGHFIILRGSALDGSILVADPASRSRSLTTWDLSLVLEELSSTSNSGGPLWVISSN